jgi:hypothetical protein
MCGVKLPIRLDWQGLVFGRMHTDSDLAKDFVREPEGKIPHEGPRHRTEDNKKM